MSAYTVEGSSREGLSRMEEAPSKQTAMKLARKMRDELDSRSVDSVVTVRSVRGVVGHWRGSVDMGWHSVNFREA
jgi:hypothetical protein